MQGLTDGTIGRIWFGAGVAPCRRGVIESGSPIDLEEFQVARSCDVCGKRPVFGNQISHAHNVSSRVWYPNIQKVRVVVNRTRKRLRVCTRCLRSGAVVKAAS
jgi:large subunit ribosomal protein L28